MQANKLETLARIGFAARGIMYIIIGFLALKSGRTEGSGGALEYLSSGSGKILLAVMALGFLGYGIWRISEAIMDTEGNGSEAKGMATRAGGLVSGLIHLGLAFYAAKLAGGSRGGGSSSGAEQGAATALSLPGGSAMLVVAAIILFAAGLLQIVKAVKLGFLSHLDQHAAREDWVRWAGRLGYAARGLVFLIMAYLLWKASSGTAAQAGGVGDALGAVSGSVQMILAAGLLLFGLFSLVEARYRRINDPKVLERLQARAQNLSR